MAAQESILRVGVDSSGAEAGAAKVNASMDSMGEHALTAQEDFNKLRGVLSHFRSFLLGGLAVGLVAEDFRRLSDEATTITNRVRLVTHTTDELEAVYRQLLVVSNETRTSLEGTSTIFNRLAFNTQNLGLSYNKLLTITKALNQAVAISGVTQQEGLNGLIQLSQGLARGTLQGQDLRAVLEDVPKVGQVIAQGMGVTIGQLRNLGQQGKITAKEITDAFIKAAPALNEEFAKITPTIESAFSVLHNRLIDFIKGTNEASGFSVALANGVLYLADHFNVLASAVAGLATIIGGILLRSLAKATLAFLTSPFGLISAAVAALTIAMGIFGDTTVEVAGKTATGWQVMRAAAETAGQVIEAIAGAVETAMEVLAEGVGALTSRYVGSQADMAAAAQASGSATVSVFKTVLNFIVAFTTHAIYVLDNGWGIIKANTEVIVKAMANAVISDFETMVNGFVRGLAFLAGKVDSLIGTNFGEKITDSLTIHLDKLNADAAVAKVGKFQKDINAIWSKDWAGKAASGVAGSFKSNLDNILANQKGDLSSLLDNSFAAARDTPESSGNKHHKKTPQEKFADQIKGLREEGVELQLNNREREVRKELFKAEETLGRKLTSGETMLVTTLVQQNQLFKDQADMLEAIKGPREELNYKTDALNALLGKGKISIDEYNKELRALQIQLTALDNTVAGGVANGFARLNAEIDQTNQKVSDNLVSTYHAIVDQTNNLALTQRSLNELLNAGKISWEQYSKGMRAVIQQGYELDNSLQGGIKAGLSSVANEVDNFGKGVEGVITGAFSKATDAIVSFASTGKLAFGSFVSSILQDLLRLATQQLFAKLAGSLLGGGGLGGLFAGFKTGGSFEVGGSGGTDSQLVAFKATPGERVDVSTPQQQKAKQSDTTSHVNVPLKVVNVLDPSVVADYMNSADGERLVLNVIHRNPSVVQGAH